MRLPTLALAALLLPSPASAEPDPLERQLESIRERYALPALGAAIYVDGELAAIGVAGTLHVRSKVAVERDARWHIGANAAAMTAAVAAILVERGEIGWDSAVGELLAEVSMDPSWAQVTLRQLLSHTAGAPHNARDRGLKRGRYLKDPAAGRAIYVKRALKAPLEAAPGAYSYSNAGYVVAGAMMEAATGQPWEALIRELLFEPMEMETVDFGPPGTQYDPWGHSTLGNPNGRDRFPFPWPDNAPALSPAGGLHLTLADWARYAAVHAGAPGPLSPGSLALLHGDTGEPPMGWTIRERPDLPGPVLWHDGSNTRWLSSALVDPEREIAIVAATNFAGPGAGEALLMTEAFLLAKYGGTPGERDSTPHEEDAPSEEDSAPPEEQGGDQIGG